MTNQSMGLMRAHLTKANLKGANLAGAMLGRCTAEFADFSGANLEGADLSRCELAGADFTGANLAGADFTEADVRSALRRRGRARADDRAGLSAGIFEIIDLPRIRMRPLQDRGASAAQGAPARAVQPARAAQFPDAHSDCQRQTGKDESRSASSINGQGAGLQRRMVLPPARA